MPRKLVAISVAWVVRFNASSARVGIIAKAVEYAAAAASC